MADYICKHCKFNNNGWCVAKKTNKLKETLECETFKRGKYGDFENSKSPAKLLEQYTDDELLDEIKRRLVK